MTIIQRRETKYWSDEAAEELGMDRRSFITGLAAVGVASQLPRQKEYTIGIDIGELDKTVISVVKSHDRGIWYTGEHDDLEITSIIGNMAFIEAKDLLTKINLFAEKVMKVDPVIAECLSSSDLAGLRFPPPYSSAQ